MRDETNGFPLHLHKLACQTEKGRKRQQKQRENHQEYIDRVDNEESFERIRDSTE